MTWQPQASDTLSSPSHSELHRTHHDVKAYGAIGDGVADDTVAINAVIAEADVDGGTIFFPAGTYKVTSTISLTTLDFQHWVGGHLGPSGLIQFAMPPSVVIDGSGMASGVVVFADGGVSAAGGHHVFENIIFKGKDQGFQMLDAARIQFRNCGFSALSTSATDNCGLYMERSFWFDFWRCTFHASNTSNYSIIMRCSNGVNTDAVGLGQFSNCVLVNGGILYDVDFIPASDAGNIQFNYVLSENSNTPFITFTEDAGVASSYGIIKMEFRYVEQADAGSPQPLVQLNAAHAHMDYPRFIGTSTGGSETIEVLAGSVRGSYVDNGMSPSVNGSDVITGDNIRLKHHGLEIIGTSASVTESQLGQNAGPALRLGKSTDAYSRAGIDTEGIHYWGPGGATSTGYDTNLYRSAANTLKTDDKFLATAGLGIGNSASATTPGSVVRKMEVFDASGASLGFVPIYGSIT